VSWSLQRKLIHWAASNSVNLRYAGTTTTNTTTTTTTTTTTATATATTTFCHNKDQGNLAKGGITRL